MENKKDNFFDKYELYAFGNSIYCYEGSTVLKNKLNITDQGEFFKAESELAFTGLLELQINPIKGNFDKKHLYAIHKFLFDRYMTSQDRRGERTYPKATLSFACGNT